MSKNKHTPGFDSISDLIRARDTRNEYFRKALVDCFGRLSKRERSNSKPLVMRDLHVG